VLHNVVEDRLISSYGRERVGVGETLSIPVCRTFSQIDPDSGAVLHFLFLYENELGQLYDSYVWVRVRPPRTKLVKLTPGEFPFPGVVAVEKPLDASQPYDASSARKVLKTLAAAARKAQAVH
jgi:hypothetical protein